MDFTARFISLVTVNKCEVSFVDKGSVLVLLSFFDIVHFVTPAL